MSKRDFKAGIEAMGRVIQEYNKMAEERRAINSEEIPTPKTDKIFADAYDQAMPENGEGWDSFSDQIKLAMQAMEREKAEAIEIARIAISAIETIYGHSQWCGQCQSFEIAKQCRDEVHGFDRLNSLR